MPISLHTPNQLTSSSAERVASPTLDYSFDTLSCLTGQDAIAQSGLVPEHVVTLRAIADEKNVILMFRPVNPQSTQLLKAGAVAKGMHIKAKTSDWGPMAGFLPADPRLSKKWAHYLNESNVAVLQDSITESLKTSVFVRPLRLKPTRIKALEKMGLLEPPPNLRAMKAGAVCPLVLRAPTSGQGNPAEHFEFQLKAVGLDEFDVLYRPKGDASWRNVEVLHAQVAPVEHDAPAGPATPPLKPITADYDVFAMLPHLQSPLLKPFQPVERSKSQQLWHNSVSTLSRNSLSSELGSRRSSFASQDFIQAVNHLREEHLGQSDRHVHKPNIGREPAWQERLRCMINDGLGADSGDLLQHATEMDNVFYPEQDDNIFIVRPHGECLLTQNWDQVQAAMHVANALGYAGYINRNYNHRAGTRPIYPNLDPSELRSDGPIIPFNGLKAYQRLTQTSNHENA